MNKLRLAAATALLLHGAHAAAGEPIDESRDVAADAIIDIEILFGDVTLTGWDENRFQITGELSDAADGYTLRSINGGIRFEEELDRRSFNNCWAFGNRCDDGERAQLDIRVPRNSVLRFEGTNIEVTIDGVYGATDIEVVNGDVNASNLRGTISIETVNGTIDATGLNGRISLETVNGDIDDNGSEGSRLSLNTTNGDIDTTTRSLRVSADTTNGDIDIDAGALDELHVSTVGGDLEARVALNPRGEININSVSGRIELSVPDTTSARFNVQTAANGRIDNQLSDDRAQRRNRYVNSQELDFTLNGGDGDVSISTVSGNVSLRRD
ncbi:MAG: DUF4097 family beta strand repeat-containing protein [Pseudomonadota bacterium]|nr:DUF4097 family beta strand repeat-containing protein [Pseudomonadota bacterium]